MKEEQLKEIEALKRDVKSLFLVDSPWFEDDLLDNVIDHLHAQGYLNAKREGFVLVPIEPTDEMCIFGARENDIYNKSLKDCMTSVYKAMIKASEKIK